MPQNDLESSYAQKYCKRLRPAFFFYLKNFVFAGFVRRLRRSCCASALEIRDCFSENLHDLRARRDSRFGSFRDNKKNQIFWREKKPRFPREISRDFWRTFFNFRSCDLRNENSRDSSSDSDDFLVRNFAAKKIQRRLTQIFKDFPRLKAKQEEVFSHREHRGHGEIFRGCKPFGIILFSLCDLVLSSALFR